MKRTTILRAGALGAGVSALLALVACATTDSEGEAAAPDTDASTVIVPDGGGPTPDAADAADAPVEADAGPRICSDDGFCHTTVPKGQNLRSVWGDGLGVVWAVSYEGNILRWDGTSWKIHVHATDGEEGLFSIFGTGPTDVWIPSDHGLLHGTGTSSATLVFAPVALPGKASVLIKGIWGTGPNDLWAVGGTESFDQAPFSVGRAVHYNGAVGDGGAGWKLDTDLTARGIAYRAIWGSPGSGPWVQGGEANEFGEFSGVVLRRAPGDTAWKRVALPPDPDNTFHPQPQYLVAASLSSDTSVWLGGFNGDFVSSYWHGTKATDGGTGFDFTYTERFFWERPVIALWGTAPNDTWAVGQEGLVQHWDGATWNSAAIRVTPLPVVKTFWGIWGTSSTDFWIVGDEIALHKTTTGKP